MKSRPRNRPCKGLKEEGTGEELGGVTGGSRSQFPCRKLDLIFWESEDGKRRRDWHWRVSFVWHVDYRVGVGETFESTPERQ